MLEAGIFSQKSGFKSQFHPSNLRDPEEAPRLNFPVHEMRIVGSGHILLRVGTRLPFRMKPRMKVLWQLAIECGYA